MFKFIKEQFRNKRTYTFINVAALCLLGILSTFIGSGLGWDISAIILSTIATTTVPLVFSILKNSEIARKVAVLSDENAALSEEIQLSGSHNYILLKLQKPTNRIFYTHNTFMGLAILSYLASMCCNISARTQDHAADRLFYSSVALACVPLLIYLVFHNLTARQFRKYVGQLEDEKSILDTFKLKNLEGNNDNLNNTISNNDKQIIYLEEENQEKQKKVSTLEQTVAGLQQNISNFNLELNQLNEEKNEQISQIQELKASLEENKQENVKYCVLNEQLQEKLNKKNSKMKKLCADFDEQEKELDKIQKLQAGLEESQFTILEDVHRFREALPNLTNKKLEIDVKLVFELLSTIEKTLSTFSNSREKSVSIIDGKHSNIISKKLQ